MNEDKKDQVTNSLTTAASTVATAPVVSDSPEARANRVVEDWMSTLRNSAFSRHTASYNYLQGQLPVLSKLIEKEITK